MTDEPYWKVRVAVGGGLLHLASTSEPVVERDADGAIVALNADLISDGLHADVLGWIDWTAVKAVSWRRSA